jgi:D-alanine-D-alanine ligase
VGRKGQAAETTRIPKLIRAPVPSKVILLWNVNLGWDAHNWAMAQTDNQLVVEGLTSEGFHVEEVCLYESVERALGQEKYDSREWLILNWCDGYADRPSQDYDVVEEMERLDYLFTGSGSATLRVARDKALVRSLLQAAGVSIARGLVARSPSDVDDWHIFPAIVKPVDQHASIGITHQSLVMDNSQLRSRVEYVLDLFRTAALVEDFIEGREFTATVWGNTSPVLLPIVEMDYAAFAPPVPHIRSYEAKFAAYEPGEPEILSICPPALDSDTLARIRAHCLLAYRAIGCRDYARIDVRMRQDQPYVVDVNPNPDLAELTDVHLSAQALGLSYGGMMAQIVRYTQRRWLDDHPGSPGGMGHRSICSAG